MVSRILNHIPRAISKLHCEVVPVIGAGAHVYTAKGTKYLDYTSGIGALSTGHSHPQVIMEVKNQLNQIVHAPQQVFGTHEPQIELTQRLLEVMPTSNLNSFFYTNSGSESTDNALKIARRATGKTNIIAINGGFHGRTLGAMSVSSSNVNSKMSSQPLIPGIFFTDPTISDLDKVLSYQTAPEETAAIIFEPVQGEVGIKNLSNKFVKYIQEIGKKHNILLIADEVQCGFGRTGTYWNIEQKSITADILTFGKGIASGFPLAGVAANKELMDALNPGYLGGTYGCNAIAAIAAKATIDVFKTENVLSNVNEQAQVFKTEIEKVVNIVNIIKEVRQYGLMIAIEFTEPHIATEVVKELRENHYILALLAGNKGQYLRLLPPLITSEAEIKEVIEALSIILAKFEENHNYKFYDE
jgi:4-aminobutyrate aminotransferase